MTPDSQQGGGEGGRMIISASTERHRTCVCVCVCVTLCIFILSNKKFTLAAKLNKQTLLKPRVISPDSLTCQAELKSRFLEGLKPCSVHKHHLSVSKKKRTRALKPLTPPTSPFDHTNLPLQCDWRTEKRGEDGERRTSASRRSLAGCPRVKKRS